VNDDSTWLWVLGLLAAGVVALLVFGSTPQTPVVEPPASGPAVSTAPESRGVLPVLPPIVEAGKDLTLDERESVRLDGEGRSVSGGAVSYRWEAAGGRGTFDDRSAKRPVYTAPSICGCEECVTLALTVSDDRGASAVDRLTVRVRNPFDCGAREAPCPCAAIGRPCGRSVLPLPEPPCGAASSCGCERPCPAPAATSGPCDPPVHPCDRPCVTHVSAPEPTGPIAFPCSCTACQPIRIPAAPHGSCPCEEPADRPWYLPSPPCLSGSLSTPLVSRQYARSVEEGGSVALHGTIGGSNCSPVCFRWTADKGWFENPDSLNPIWHAPKTGCWGGDEACITLSSTEACGGRGYDQIRVRISDPRLCRTQAK